MLGEMPRTSRGSCSAAAAAERARVQPGGQQGCEGTAMLAVSGVPVGVLCPQGRGQRGGGALRGPATAHHADRAQHGRRHRRAHRRGQPAAQPAGALHDRRGGG